MNCVDLVMELAQKEEWNFPLGFPISYGATENDNLAVVQMYLKAVTWVNQDGLCICKKNSPIELHHALISRKDAQGVENPFFIHDSRNCILLCRSCHKDINRETSLKLLSRIFGEDEIRDWYKETLDQFLKSNPRRL
jgi:hypothetical protein